MAIVSLLTFPDSERGRAAFIFDHAQEHAKLTRSIHINAASLANYQLDPVIGDMGGADMWSMNHQQAHDDAAAWYNVKPSIQLIDSTTLTPGPLNWFLFINSQEHAALSLAALKQGSGS